MVAMNINNSNKKKKKKLLLSQALKGKIWSTDLQDYQRFCSHSLEDLDQYLSNQQAEQTLISSPTSVSNSSSRHTIHNMPQEALPPSFSPSYQHQQQAHNYPRSPSTASHCEFDYSHQRDPAHGTSSQLVATFNLIATIVGGGVLSVPFAFQKCGGALWGILWMILAAALTDQSCQMLCWSARPHTAMATAATATNNATSEEDTTPQVLSSYGQVGRAAFGPIMEMIVSALLFVFLVFVLIAYMVLVKDIWTPVLLEFGMGSAASQEERQTRDAYWGPFVLLAIILLMGPFLIQRTLHALRFNCYVGFASVSILCLALCHHALLSNGSGNDETTFDPSFSNVSSLSPSPSSSSTITNVLYTTNFWLRPPDSIHDVITAFPILMLSFLCHFNVNPIQKALIHPTPQRVSAVVHGAMMGCGLLMTLFGVAGYAYVVGNTQTSTTVQGNILLNCEEQMALYGMDWSLLLGRIGCGITIMLAMAIMILPCRDSLLEVLDTLVYKSYHVAANSEGNAAKSTDKQFDVEATSLLANKGNNDQEWLDTMENPPSLTENNCIHTITTVGIVTLCYIVAIKVPGVAIVWSLCGSSMAFAIAFMLPAACFLQLVHQQEQESELCNKDRDGRSSQVVPMASKALAWIMLVMSILAAIFCTLQTIQSIA